MYWPGGGLVAVCTGSAVLCLSSSEVLLLMLFIILFIADRCDKTFLKAQHRYPPLAEASYSRLSEFVVLNWTVPDARLEWKQCYPYRIQKNSLFSESFRSQPSLSNSRRGSMLWLFCGKTMLATLGNPGFYFYCGWSYILFVLHFKDLEAVLIEFVLATIRSDVDGFSIQTPSVWTNPFANTFHANTNTLSLSMTVV